MIKLIMLIAVVIAISSAGHHLLLVLWSFQEFLFVLRLGLRPPEFNHGVSFFFRGVRRVYAINARRARRQIKHVAFAQQRFSAVGIKNGARIDLGGHAERNT